VTRVCGFFAIKLDLNVPVAHQGNSMVGMQTVQPISYQVSDIDIDERVGSARSYSTDGRNGFTENRIRRIVGDGVFVPRTGYPYDIEGARSVNRSHIELEISSIDVIA
jgi:hypothetical protein